VLGFIENGIFVAVIAHGLIGISLIWDKVLLKNPGTRNLFSYVFWLGSLSVFGVLLVPFGYKSAPLVVIVVAFAVGVVHLVAVFFYYVALKYGEASETLAIMGGFSPVATMVIGFALLSQRMTGGQLIGFALMTAGGFVMFFSEKIRLKRLMPPMLLASGLMGLAEVGAKVVYNHTNFITGSVWFTIGTFTGAMALLIPREWRRQIFSEASRDNPRNRFWYFANRFVAGVGSFLFVYAISLTYPAMVDAISGVRYAIIFVGALLLTNLKPRWLKENFGGWRLATKVVATTFVIAGLALASISGGNDAARTVSASRRHRPQRTATRLELPESQSRANLSADYSNRQRPAVSLVPLR